MSVMQKTEMMQWYGKIASRPLTVGTVFTTPTIFTEANVFFFAIFFVKCVTPPSIITSYTLTYMRYWSCMFRREWIIDAFYYYLFVCLFFLDNLKMEFLPLISKFLHSWYSSLLFTTADMQERTVAVQEVEGAWRDIPQVRGAWRNIPQVRVLPHLPSSRHIW